MGISTTRDGARQFVSHRHITVNGKIVNIPSYQVKAGDIIAVREKSKSLTVIIDSVNANSKSYPWIEFDKAALEGKFMSIPERTDIPENIKEQLIVELYSK
jgi:small subunit ribosomal protein S4